MEVSVTLDLSVVPEEKHVIQMRAAAHSLTDDPKSVQVSCPPTSPKQICAQFSVPDARQADVVDRIARRFWQVQDYDDSRIGFSRRTGRVRRTRGSSQRRESRLDGISMKATSGFKEALGSWHDVDGAMYNLAIALGILEPGTPFATDAKHVLWSSNELGDMLFDILTMMVKIGALECNEDEMKYRWNPQFKWREASSRKGR